jgi:hypothetical protein
LKRRIKRGSFGCHLKERAGVGQKEAKAAVAWFNALIVVNRFHEIKLSGILVEYLSSNHSWLKNYGKRGLISLLGWILNGIVFHVQSTEES